MISRAHEGHKKVCSTTERSWVRPHELQRSNNPLFGLNIYEYIVKVVCWLGILILRYHLTRNQGKILLCHPQRRLPSMYHIQLAQPLLTLLTMNTSSRLLCFQLWSANCGIPIHTRSPWASWLGLICFLPSIMQAWRSFSVADGIRTRTWPPPMMRKTKLSQCSRDSGTYRGAYW